MRCALVVGHKPTSPGASNAAHDLTEWEYNTRLAVDIWRRFRVMDSSHEIVPVFRRTWASLPQDVNQLEPNLVVAMHCNAFNRHVSGTETLYYHRSESGHEIAESVQETFVRELGLADRGVRPITQEDRGGRLLSDTKAPAILCEPFFIDNDDDLGHALSLDMAAIYSHAIEEVARFT